jgi:hypothetical protein
MTQSARWPSRQEWLNSYIGQQWHTEGSTDLAKMKIQARSKLEDGRYNIIHLHSAQVPCCHDDAHHLFYLDPEDLKKAN